MLIFKRIVKFNNEIRIFYRKIPFYFLFNKKKRRMKNAQSQINQNQQNNSLLLDQQSQKPSTKVNFKYIKPLTFQNEEQPQTIQLKQNTANKENKKYTSTIGERSTINQQLKRSKLQKKNDQSKIFQQASIHKYSLLINMNRSLDQFHKKFESIKVKWNQFIKIKKINFFLDYQVVYQIGQGPYGNVYKVKALHTGMFRAAKKIYKNKLTDDLQQLLFDEITIMMSLDHPNINKILEVYEQPDFYVILMELCEGGELLNKIIAKSLTQSAAALIIKQILRALKYIHSKNIIHRDLKPEKMLFEKGSNLIKIVDFGIATIKKNEKLTQRMGTPYYMAPEVLMKNYDEKCDIWACGVIFYMIIFGYPPFSGADEVEIMRNILNKPIKFEGQKWNRLSESGKEFLKGLLQKDPERRFTTKQAFDHPWLANGQQPYSNLAQYDWLKNLCRFHFKNKLEAVVLTYIVSQVLSSTEKLPMLKSFIEADSNGDGVLSYDELKDLIKRKNPQLYVSLKVETFDKLLKSIDLNNSGEIDYTEFLIATLKRSQITKQHLQRAFSYFDINHNGAITFSEIIQFTENSNQSLNSLRKMFQKVDQNGDGEISKEEFFKLMANK